MNVLIIKGSVEDTAAALQLDASVVKSALERALQLLYDVRKTRPKPHLDTKIITSWNGKLFDIFLNLYVLPGICGHHRSNVDLDSMVFQD